MSSGACRALVAVLLTLVATIVMALPVVADTEELTETSTVIYKVNPTKGTVDVTVEATADGAVFSVSDTGVGIDPDELEHVFDRFYRGTRRREERAGGSGLGLAIARSIVDMHHGRISISSTPDVGTQVLVTLPQDIEGSSPTDPRG